MTRKGSRRTEQRLKPGKTAMLLFKVFGNFIRNAVATAAEGTLGVSREAVDGDEMERLYQVSWNPTVKLHRLGKPNFVSIVFGYFFPLGRFEWGFHL